MLEKNKLASALLKKNKMALDKKKSVQAKLCFKSLQCQKRFGFRMTKPPPLPPSPPLPLPKPPVIHSVTNIFK